MRRRFSRRRGVVKRERHWVAKSFPAFLHPNGYVQGFEIVSPEDYLEGDNPAVVDHCTILRTVGTLDVDPFINIPLTGNSTMAFSAALVVESENAITNAITADPTLIQYDPYDPLLGVRSRIVQHFLCHSFVLSVFRQEVDPTFYMPVYTGDEQRLGVSWDVTQKVRMRTDEALWLFVQGLATNTVGDGEDWVSEVCSRTLFAT